eukprot:TRINITY_DN10262_c0_g1_i1.p1 TRINITY_DN10262_c0_g1~~TRINITY_DN10262_c0_g1_i1.p1  ORF type:complete len:279 (+),score=56.64 TRINITY_DN10262_c0_g1_i1:85-921(+)
MFDRHVQKTDIRHANREDLLPQVVKNLAAFAKASDVERRCLLAVAAKTYSSDLKQFVKAYQAVDADGDGFISYTDLAGALDGVSYLYAVPLDTAEVFLALDLDGNGHIDFAEFSAACLYDQLSPLDDWLAEQVFHSLDADRDGWLRSEDLRGFFRQLPPGLPSKRPFVLAEWKRCLLKSVGKPSTSSRTRTNGGADALTTLFTNCSCRKDCRGAANVVEIEAEVVTSDHSSSDAVTLWPYDQHKSVPLKKFQQAHRFPDLDAPVTFSSSPTYVSIRAR